MKMFDGGVWAIEGDELHLNIPKLLKRLGLPDTEENRDLATKIALDVAKDKVPDVVRFVVTKDGSYLVP
jgi:hypothetical protein